MTYRIKGTLKLPDGAPAANCEIEFVSRKNFSPLVQGAKTNILTSVTGAYDVTLELGEYAVILYTGGTYPAQVGTILLSADTVAGQDLPSLLQHDGWTPATPDYVQQIENWVASASHSASSAEASADAAADSAEQASLNGSSVVSREALRRSYAEAGYNLVDGSFEDGGVLVNTSDVLLRKANGKVYSWGGTLPKDVVAGSSPVPESSTTWVDRTDGALRDELASDGGAGLIGLSQEIASIMRGTLAYRLQDHLDASCEPFNGDLNAAITTAYNLGIGAVAFSRELPAQGVVHCKPGVSIIGAGGKASLTTTVNSTGAIVATGVSDVHIEGFKINGSGLSDPSDIQNGDTGIYINDSSNITVMRMHIDGCYAWGVVSTGSQCKNIRYIQNRFTNIKNQSAMACDNGTSDFLVCGNIVDGCKLYGFEAEDNGATVVSNGKVMCNLFKRCVAGVSVNFGVENVEIFSNTVSQSDISNDISGAYGFGIFLNGNTTNWPRNLNIHHNTVVGTKKHCFAAIGPMDDVIVEDNVFIKGSISGSTSEVVSIASGAKNRLIYRNNKHHVSNRGSSFVLNELYDSEVTGNRFQDAGSTILNMGGTIVNCTIEAPIVRVSDISSMTGADQINTGGSNYIYDKRNNDVTVVSGSTVGKSVRVLRNTKIIGVQWCINTAAAPGSPSDYWALKINGVDQPGIIQTDIANTDCWAYTQVNKLVSAGSVLTIDVASSVGYSYNYFKYRLITI